MSNGSRSIRTEVISDITLILAIPTFLTSIYFLIPTNVQQQLALRPNDPQWYTLFTAAYVHANVDHLRGNVIGYLLAAGYAYWLCFCIDQRQWFRRTTLGLLVVTPIVVNGVNLLTFGTYLPEVNGLSRGFSGVVGGSGGFLLIAFVLAVWDIYNSEVAQVVGVTLCLLLLQLTDVVYSRRVRPLVGTLVTFGIALQVVGGLHERGWELPAVDVAPRPLGFHLISGGLVSGVLALLVLRLFPATLVEGGTFVNVIAHGTGALTGCVLSIVCFAVTE